MSEFPKIAKTRLAASQSGGAGAQHPDADLLNDFAERRLAGQERESVTSHLATCSDCREVVSLAVAAAPEAAMAEEPMRQPIRWTWMRWAIPAASMAIILVAVSLRWQETGGNLETKRPVDAYVPQPKAAEPASTAQAKASVEQKTASTANKVAAVAAPQLASPVAGGGGRGEMAQSSNGKLLADTRADAAAGAATRSQNYESHSTRRESQPGFVAGGAAAQLERDGRPASPPVAVASGAAAPATLAAEKKDEKTIANDPAQNTLATKSKSEQDKISASSESVEISAPAKPATKELAKQRKAESTGGLVGNLDESQLAADSASSASQAYAAPAVSRQMAASKQVLAGNEPNLWRGGKAGALFRSTDGGKTWKQVAMTSGGKAATSDVFALEVAGKNVTVRFADGSVWKSTDEGNTWKVQAPAPAKK